MKKILFLIHDLGHGGAEKVLVNLVNNMDRTKFDISVISLFGGGVNEQFLAKDIHYRAVFKKEFRGNSHIMKLFTPQQLHRWIVKDFYDIEVSYLEGPATRIVSGCETANTKLVSWVHCTIQSKESLAIGFRSVEEVQMCYNRINQMAFVSEDVRAAFLQQCPYMGKTSVLYNVNESKNIIKASKEELSEPYATGCLHLAVVGKLMPNKGFDRMLRIVKRLSFENYPVHLHILGAGPQQAELEQYIEENSLASYVTLHGYQTNPYKYVAAADLFVCSSYEEGFSTAATEALIVGTPVCTMEVSGMKEMLGENNEYGVIVPNDEDALCQAIKRFIDEPDLLTYYTAQAVKRGKDFTTSKTVRAVEKMMEKL